MDLKGKIYREKGCYWLHKPSEHSPSPLKTLTDWWERRATRKRRESWIKYRTRIAPALAHFRYRAAVDGIRIFKSLVEEEDKLDKKMQRTL